MAVQYYLDKLWVVKGPPLLYGRKNDQKHNLLYDSHDIRDERNTYNLAFNLTRSKVLRCLLKNCQHGLKTNGNYMYHQF